MLSQLFLGMSLIGSEWVLYFLILLSIYSISLIVERILFFRCATQGIEDIRHKLRNSGSIRGLATEIEGRLNTQPGRTDLETNLISTLIKQPKGCSIAILSELANDTIIRQKIKWEKNLAFLATIGTNSPFIGLFGTVLGIIKAFHDLSQQAATGAQTVTAGISEALVATAVGILVAIPAVVAFNLFSRKVKSEVAQAEATKSYMIGKLSQE